MGNKMHKMHNKVNHKFLENVSEIAGGFDADEVTTIFKSFDGDGNGVLDKEEAMFFLAKYCKYKRVQDLGPDFLEELFNKLDIDGDGTLSHEELLRHGETFSQKDQDRHSRKVEKGEKKLILSVSSGTVDDVRKALLVKDAVDATNEHGESALGVASRTNNAETARLLLEAGANKEIRDNSHRTPLMTAAFAGSADVLGLLLEHGAEKEPLDENGWTPLMYAVGTESVRSVDLLLSAHASTTTVGKDGMTVTNIAKTSQKASEILALLADHEKIRAQAVTDVATGNAESLSHFLDDDAKNDDAKTDDAKTEQPEKPKPTKVFITPEMAKAKMGVDALDASAYQALKDAGDAGYTSPETPGRLALITIDFDGTLETTDKLAHEIFEESTDEEKKDNLAPAFERYLAKVGKERLVDDYFGGQARVGALRQGLDVLRKELAGQVYVLSASWDPIPGATWAAYIAAVSDELGLGFDAAHIIGIDDPGGVIPAEKGVALKELASRENIPLGEAVHVDNSFKYCVQALTLNANGMSAAPLQPQDLDYLATRP